MATVKKFINNDRDIVGEMLEGFVAAFPNHVEKIDDYDVIVRKDKKTDGVGLVIGNGAGHEPAVIGWVGDGMLDANAVGGIFAAPGPDTIYQAVKHSDSGNGVVLLISNHAGDVINSEIALEMLKEDGIQAEGIILYDDIASAPKEFSDDRRGALGTLFNYKITGAYAEKESDILKVCEMAKKVRNHAASLSVALLPGTSPVTGEKMFELPENEIEIGMGVHGEAAVGRMKLKSADEIVEIMYERLSEDMGLKSGDQIIPIVNGCGSTTMMELMIVYRKLQMLIRENGMTAHKPLVGEFVTTQEMAGLSIALLKADDEMIKLWDESCKVPYFPAL